MQLNRESPTFQKHSPSSTLGGSHWQLRSSIFSTALQELDSEIEIAGQLSKTKELADVRCESFGGITESISFRIDRMLPNLSLPSYFSAKEQWPTELVYEIPCPDFIVNNMVFIIVIIIVQYLLQQMLGGDSRNDRVNQFAGLLRVLDFIDFLGGGELAILLYAFFQISEIPCKNRINPELCGDAMLESGPCKNCGKK